MCDNSPVFMADNDDPLMQEAVKRARQSFRFFWRELSWEYRRIVPGLDVSAIKVAFSDVDEPSKDDPVEQMWVGDVNFDGIHISGTLMNDPQWLTSVEQGDEIKLPVARVTDWMYAIDGIAYGAFTVHIIRSQMGKAERRSHDEAWGLDFGPPDSYRVVPSDYLPKQLRSGTPSITQMAEIEHPMAINMVESMKEFASHPDHLTSTDDHGFTILHQLSLAGANRCVEALLKLGADPSKPAKNGMTPLALARRLGWKQVQETLTAHGAKK
ncbi:MAG: DUF2314 domain-containing protein [Planctomycetaceae bacterium]